MKEKQTIHCDECTKEFELKLRTRKLKDSIEEVFFRCPKCKKKYIAFYTNDEVKKLQTEIRETRLQSFNAMSDPVTTEEEEKQFMKKSLHLEREMIRKQNILKYVMQELEEEVSKGKVVQP